MSAWPIALSIILPLEGGCVDYPDDPGGATCYGITQTVYDAWRQGQGLEPQPVVRITREEVANIYHERYWAGEPAWWDRAGHPGVALYLFDMRVQHGRWRDIYAQAEEVLREHPLLGLAELREKRMQYYTSLRGWPTFGRGWARREARVYAEAVRLEHPKGQLRVGRLNLNGVEWDVGIARIVRERLWVRGSRVAPPCPWWRRIWRRCAEDA